MKQRTRYSWKQIDPLLLLACLAPSPTERERLLGRLVKRYGMNRRTLIRRLDFLGARFAPKLLGPGAIEAYERQMALVIQGVKIVAALRQALMTNIDRLKEQNEARQRSSMSIREAASMLRVRPGLLRSWVLDLGVIHLNESGKVPLSEIRRFIASDWKWLLPSRRLQPSAREKEYETATNDVLFASWHGINLRPLRSRKLWSNMG